MNQEEQIITAPVDRASEEWIRSFDWSLGVKEEVIGIKTRDPAPKPPPSSTPFRLPPPLGALKSKEYDYGSLDWLDALDWPESFRNEIIEYGDKAIIKYQEVFPDSSGGYPQWVGSRGDIYIITSSGKGRCI